MTSVLIIVHVVIIVFLTVVVMLQSSKGGGLGTGFGGGGSDTLFGSSGSGNFLTKLTSGLALLFMITSVTITALQSKTDESSVFDQGIQVEQQAPADPQNLNAPEASESKTEQPKND